MPTKQFQISLLLFIALTLSVAGCYRQSFVDKTKTVEQQPSQEFWQKNLVFGFVAGPDINMEEACPGGIAKVEEYFSFPNGIATFITLGLFSPYTIKLYCAAGSSSYHQDGATIPPGDEKERGMGGLKPIPRNILGPKKKGEPTP